MDRQVRRGQRLSTALITDTALALMERQGYERVTMRSIASALGTGPASLYAHVENRAQLDQMVVDRIATQLEYPECHDRGSATAAIDSVARQLFEAYCAHPGVARAALGLVPLLPGTLRMADRLLDLLNTAGLRDADAAWAVDLLVLYTASAAFEVSIADARDASVDPEDNDQLERFFAALPPNEFPTLLRASRHLASGTPADRFGFGLHVILGGLRTLSGERADSEPQPIRAS